MTHKIDGPLDNYSPFQPFDSGPPEGDSEDESVCSSESMEAKTLEGQARDWPKGNKFNICYGCGNTFRGPGWKIKPLCAVCEPEKPIAVNVGTALDVPAEATASLSEWYDEVERNHIQNEIEAEERERAAQEQLQDETDDR